MTDDTGFIGPFRIVRKLGEEGMGIVDEAGQQRRMPPWLSIRATLEAVLRSETAVRSSAPVLSHRSEMASLEMSIIRRI